MSPLDQLSDDDRRCLRKSEFPTWTAPMLATLTHKYFSDSHWIFERKLDGERVVAFCHNHEVRLMTRNRKVINETYPEIVGALENAISNACILDGEVVAFQGHVTSFSRLQRRMQIADSEKARKSHVAVYYYLFDILYLDKYHLDELPLSSRKRVLKRVISYDDPLRLTIHRNAEGEAYLKEACEKGWEGLIAKRADSKYQHNRSTDWLKFKCQRGQELVIGGFTEPRGSRKGFGALLVGYYEDDKLRYAGKVGTGFDEETLIRMRKHFEPIIRKTSPFDDEIHEKEVTWLRPKLVGEFGFTEWTKDGKLRHSRFLGLRRDKNPQDVKREEGQ